MRFSNPPMKKLTLISALLLVSLGVARAQKSDPTGTKTFTSDEADVTVYRATEGQSLNIKTHGGDGIAILSDSVSWTPATEMDSEGDSEPGEALFLEQGTKRLFYPNSGDDNAFSIYLVDLKHHWARPMAYCDQSKRCLRAMKVGHRTMGAARLFFSNGEVTAARYQVFKGGTVTQQYSTAKNKYDVLIVALGPILISTASGEPSALENGQARLFKNVDSLAVRATTQTAMYVAIRLPAVDTP